MRQAEKREITVKATGEKLEVFAVKNAGTIGFDGVANGTIIVRNPLWREPVPQYLYYREPAVEFVDGSLPVIQSKW